eukprot:6207658-Pleurochrysis_carterae.AAC.3
MGIKWLRAAHRKASLIVETCESACTICDRRPCLQLVDWRCAVWACCAGAVASNRQMPADSPRHWSDKSCSASAGREAPTSWRRGSLCRTWRRRPLQLRSPLPCLCCCLLRAAPGVASFAGAAHYPPRVRYTVPMSDACMLRVAML